MTSSKSDRKAGRWAARSFVAVGTAALALSAAACTEGSDNPDPDASTGGQAVLFVERVFSPQGLRSYFVSVLPDVPAEAIDRSKAMELTSADVEVYNDRVYIRDRDANKITRYRVGADRLEQDGEPVSFAGTGVAANRYWSAYLSPDRAYLMDAGGWRLIGWNPTEMVLTGEIISIMNMAKPLPRGAINAPVRVGDRLVAPISWTDRGKKIVYAGSGAIVLDAASTDGPLFIEDARLGGAFRTTSDNGDVYMTGVVDGDIRMFGTAMDGTMPSSGLLRLPAGETAFDPAYLVDIEAITGAKAVWAVHRIDDTTVLAQILDPEATPTNFSEYEASQDWMFVLINTEARTWAPVDSLPKGGRTNAGNHVVDGKLYIQIGDADGTSVAYAADADGVIRSFTVPGGDIWHLERVR
jgi:hypothetical protein